MTYPICGNCLHSKNSHTAHNGKFMYCATCFKMCELDEYETILKPTDVQTVMEMSAKKQ